MPPALYPSPFSDLASVEAWDAWFRWRERGRLRDVSIEDTWSRVATSLATAEPHARRAAFASDLTDALAAWRLLPDERVLASAGTGRITWRTAPLCAALNVAAFVASGAHPAASSIAAQVSGCAALAVRALDDAARVAGIRPQGLHVGVVGLADALALLGLGYDSGAGRAQARSLIGAVAAGCLRANEELAAERGASHGVAPAALARSPDARPPLLRDAARHRLRYAHVTAITSQPRLALLANAVADGIDPLSGSGQTHTIAAPTGPRTFRSAGYALNVLRTHGDASLREPDSLRTLPVMAQIRMRAALQPWVDVPIAYPLAVLGAAAPNVQRDVRAQAAALGLPAPAWRDASRGSVLEDAPPERPRRR